MITPQFELSQDDDFVHVRIRAPYIKASLMQFEVQDELFVFSLPPYYLRLRFPGMVMEDERMASKYDVSTSTVHCQVAKKTAGEHFEDLDMLSKLLAKKPVASKPLISEIDDGNPEDQPADEMEDIDWEVDQKVMEPIMGTNYGFNDAYKEIIGLSLHTGNEINELDDPEQASVEERKQATQRASEQFNVEHYWADLFDNEELPDILAWKQPDYTLSSTDKDRLLKLPKKTFLISRLKPTYLGVLQLLFGYSYDNRVNTGDSTVESAWTVGKLCPMMSTLDNEFSRVDELVKACTIRSLVFPLVRNWELTMKVWQDVVETLKAGRSAVLHRLVQLLAEFESDLHQAYRQVWLEDYALWIQYASEKVVQSLGTELEAAVANLKKADVGLDLEESEAAAQEALQAGDSDDEDEE